MLIFIKKYLKLRNLWMKNSSVWFFFVHPLYIWSHTLSSFLDTLLKVSETTSPQKLFANDCVTLYMAIGLICRLYP